MSWLFGGSLWYAFVFFVSAIAHIPSVANDFHLQNGCRSTLWLTLNKKPMLSHNDWMNCISTTHILATSKTPNIKHQVSINQSRQALRLWHPCKLTAVSLKITPMLKMNIIFDPLPTSASKICSFRRRLRCPKRLQERQNLPISGPLTARFAAASNKSRPQRVLFTNRGSHKVSRPFAHLGGKKTTIF